MLKNLQEEDVVFMIKIPFFRTHEVCFDEDQAKVVYVRAVIDAEATEKGEPLNAAAKRLVHRATHIIPKIMGGDGSFLNIMAQNSNLNQKLYKKVTDGPYSHIKNQGTDKWVEIAFYYDTPHSERPVEDPSTNYGPA